MVTLGLRARHAPRWRCLDTTPSRRGAGRPGPERHMRSRPDPYEYRPNILRIDTRTPPIPHRAGPCTCDHAHGRRRLGSGSGLGLGCAHACKSATRRRGLAQGSGAAPGRTRVVSACATRATRLARTRKRALSLVAHQCKLSRTACDRSGTRRVGRARWGGAGRPCSANACEEGPPPRACKR